MANEFVVKNGAISPNLQLTGSTSGSSTIVASATASGTLTLPAATDTLVGKATTDTLTNKTIAAGSNTISGLTNSNLSGSAGITNANLANSSITINGSAISLGGSVSNLALTTGNLSQFAATTSAQLLGVISDETGSGALVFGTSPTIKTSVVAGSASMDIFNTTATTVNAFGAATTISLGAATGTLTLNNANTVITGNLTVNGTTTTINATTITVDDINIELGSVDTPTDITAAGGGITLKGATDKTISWSSTNGWTSSETFNLASGKTYKINGTDVLSSSTLGSGVTASSLTSVGTITTGTWSGSFGAVSGANLTSLTAGNLTGTIPSTVLGNSTVYVGTTAVALNRASANLALTGISSIALPGATSGTITITPAVVAGTTAITIPATAGTLVTTGDTGSVTSTMIADGTIVNADINASAAIAVSKLAASTISGVTLGSNLNALTIGTGLSGTSYNGSAAVTIAIDSTVATLSGTQTLTNKTLTYPAIDNIKWGISQIATAAGTTTLTATSQMQQRFTGTSTQTVVLPVTSTLSAGTRYLIENASTGNITVNSSGGNLVWTVIPGTTVEFSCIGTTLTTAADWDAEIFSFAASTGSGSVVMATSPTLTTPNIGAATGTSLSLSGNLTAATGLSISNSTSFPASGTLNATNGNLVIGGAGPSNTISFGTSNATSDGWVERIRLGNKAAQGSSTITLYEPTTFNSPIGASGTPVASTTSKLFIYGDTTIVGANRSIFGNLYYDTGWKYAANGYGWGFRENNAGVVEFMNTPTTNAAGAGAAATVNLGAIASYDLVNSRLGIGTSAPAAKAHIKGTWVNGEGILQIDADSGTQYSGLTMQNNGTVKFYMYNDNTNGYNYIGSSGTEPIVFGYNSTSEWMRLNSTGLGIGTNNPLYKLHVNGSFAATTKSFVIDHPTKEGKKLRYGSLEGPENGVYVRGKLKGSSVIELPEYWTKLVDPDSITVNLTPIGKYQKLYVMEIKDNKVYVGNENLWGSDFECFYTVYGERCDVEKLEVEID